MGQPVVSAGMMHDQTLWDLVTTERVPIDDLVAAVDAYLADPTIQSHPLGSGYTIDLAAAVAAHQCEHQTAKRANTDKPSRRIEVRSALLLATPTRLDCRGS